jgi:hypothetical protein
MELPAISWIALRRPAVLGKASRGQAGTIGKAPPVHSQNIIRLITCRWGIIDTLKLMVGWVLRWLSAVRARLRQGLDLLLPCAISSWCCNEQAHGVHASARVSGCAGFSYRAGGQIGSVIGSSSSPLPFCVGAVAACAQSGYPAHVAAGAADARGSIARSAHL